MRQQKVLSCAWRKQFAVHHRRQTWSRAAADASRIALAIAAAQWYVRLEHTVREAQRNDGPGALDDLLLKACVQKAI